MRLAALSSCRILLGVVFSLAVAACGGGGGGDSAMSRGQAPGPAPVVAADLQPYMQSSPWSNELVPCVSAEDASGSCTLNTLPLIGQQSGSPDLDSVMHRVVVSHSWMGQRLGEVLPLLPEEMLRLMGSVTAIVIGADIRPSFYSSTTGAIYLDPYFLWLDNAEKATISQGSDFRSGFDDELAFVSLSRYVLGEERAWQFFDLAGDETRELDDLVMPLAALLFHELAHANDFFPQSQFPFLDSSQSVLNVANSLSDQRLAVSLNASLPLTSMLWQDLAQVMYRGVDASQEQLDLDAAYVGAIFETDGASDDYGYSSIYEDVAMLFEEVMMNYYFGVDRDVGYTPRPGDPEAACSAYILDWGVRNRVADPLVRSRAEFVLERLTEVTDVSVYFVGLDSVQTLDTGVSWCDALAPTQPQPLSERSGLQSLSAHPFHRSRLI